MRCNAGLRRKMNRNRQREHRSIFLCLLCCLLVGFDVRGQSAHNQIPDPDPEIERRSFQVADGFEVNLFAADPLLAKPIQMNFDPAGRLWVACSAVYPQIQPAHEPNDKIIILEDRAGKGRADKTTIFAQGLLIPTGVVPGDGGCYVAEGTRVLHLSNADRLAATRSAERGERPVAEAPGSDRKNVESPRRRIVLSGFGTQDTHHLIHTLRWGPDGMLYFNQSVYIYSAIETPRGVRRLLGGGIWQYRPETEQLEVFARGWVYPWGHQFERWGQSFVTDGAGDQGISYLIPGATQGQTFYPAPVPPRLLEGLTPHSPKYCGHEILSGRHLPEEWRGNILANDFRAHRVCRFVLREEGSGYTVQEKAELIKTNHPGFRPVDVKMGPDGAIYIADWYNPIINHGEVDFRDPRRDHVHGRIWRVTAKGRPLVSRPNLEGAATTALLDALKSPEDWTRQQAKRVLKERGSSVVPVLRTWLQDLDSADSEYEHHLLEGLWTYQSLDIVEPTLLATLLSARDHHARAAATRVASAWHSRLNNPQELLAARVQDDHPQGRLEAVRALAQIHQPQSLELALQALDRPMDTNLDYALWLTTRELLPDWLPAFQAGRMDFRGNTRHLAFALEAAGAQAPLRPLVELLQSGKIREGRDNLLTLLAALGGPEELRLVFDEVLGGKQTPQLQGHLLLALDQAAGQRGVRPQGDLDKLEALLESDQDSIRASASRLAGRWHLESLRPHLDRLAGERKTPESVRRAAVDGLVYLGGPQTLERLNQLTDSAQPTAVRRPSIVALTNMDLKLAASRAVDWLTNDKDATDPTEIMSAFLERKNGPAVLAEALAKAKLPPDVAKLAVRTARTSGQESPALVDALTRAGGLSQIKRALSSQELQDMAAEVLKSGDPARGEALFRRSDLACFKCHAIGGAGGQVGPDLTSIGTSAPVDYLIESILLPNKAVKENYHALVVSTQDGRFFTGIKVRETNTEIILRTAEDREQAIPVKDIDERSPGGSLMPEGLVDNLTRAELVDLVRFLSELGKVGPYSAGRARLVRRWQVLDATPAALTSVAATRLAERSAQGVPAKLHLDDSGLTWSSAYGQVNGTLPLDSLPRLKTGNNTPPFAFARFQLDANSGGPIKLILNSSVGLKTWLDGEPVEAQNQLNMDVKPGLHTITIGVDLDQRKEGIRCEMEDLPSSSARVRIVAGK
jgi:putative heme-binding domain-containing protein